EGIPIDVFFKNGRNKHEDFDRLSAAITSVIYVAQSATQEILHRELKYAVSYSKDRLIIAAHGGKAVISSYIKLKKMGKHSLSYYVKKVENAAEEANALLSSMTFKNYILARVKRVIPESLGLALLRKDGSPICTDTEMEPSEFTGMISAIFGSLEALQETPELQVIAAEKYVIIICSVDKERLLAVATPEKKTVDVYIKLICDEVNATKDKKNEIG
ncbi:MAG: hypothetical protein ACTSW4_00005, partial [Candidatus Ranarchaeia archaeon]